VFIQDIWWTFFDLTGSYKDLFEVVLHEVAVVYHYALY